MKFKHGLWLLAGLFVVLCTLALAGVAELPTVPSQTGMEEGPLADGGWQYTVAIAAVLAILLSLALVAKKFANPAMRNSANRLIEVLDSAYVGPKARILVVRIGERIYAVGATEQNLTTLAELGENQDIQSLIPKRGGDERPSFAQLLQRLTH